MATGSNKTITDSYYANGKLFAGFPCKIGHNHSTISYYEGNNSFINILHQADQEWGGADGSTIIDINGFIASTGVNVTKNMSQGTLDYALGKYIVEWDGSGTVTCSNGILNYVATGPNSGTFTLELPRTTTTKRLSVVANTGGVTNIRCYLESDSAKMAGGQVWRDNIVDFFQGQESIRFMDTMSVNSSYSRYAADIIGASNISMSKEVTPEAIAELCNATGCEPWICVPHQYTSAWISEFFTRLVAVLSASIKIRVEYSNETWNSGFSEQFYYVNFSNVATEYATVSGDTFTNVGHGLLTGDRVRAFRSISNTIWDERTAFGQESYAIKLTDDTFSIADNITDAGNSIAISITSGISELRYKAVKNITGIDTNTGYANMSEAMFASVDAIVTRARCIHICGTQFRSPAVSQNRVSANMDYLAVAPYVHYTGIDGWWLLPVSTLVDTLIEESKLLPAITNSHMSYTSKPLIAYEGGDESFVNSGASTEIKDLQQAKINELFNSTEIDRLYPKYGMSLANSHIREIAVYKSHGSPWGSLVDLNITGSGGKWRGIQPSIPNGFYRGTL